MSDPDNFLSRWSRRKREADAHPEKKNEATPPSAPDREANPEDSIPPSAAPAVPEFDVSKLPPIESIGADTDISVFMQRGVPSVLRHAALRRAWAADPAIRDFVGLNENFWDAAGPDGIPGFGDLDPGFDVKRMVAELFGEIKRESKEPDTSIDQAPGTDDTRVTQIPSAPGAVVAEDISRPAENAAAQQDSPQPETPKKIARRHGGAMPQ